MADYIPKTDGQLSLWCGNMRDKIPANLGLLGLSAPDETAITSGCNAIIADIQAVEAAKATVKSVVAAKEGTKKIRLPIIRNLMKRGKTAVSYTQEVGQDLQIIGDDPADDPATFKPELTAKVFMGYVMLSFIKKFVDGVNIYWRLKGQSAWQFLARDTVSPYHDTRPLATPGQSETREYIAVGVLDDAEAGLPSDVVVAVFGG